MGSDIGIKKQFILYSFTSGGGGGGKVWRAIFSIMQWPNTVQEKYIQYVFLNKFFIFTLGNIFLCFIVQNQ